MILSGYSIISKMLKETEITVKIDFPLILSIIALIIAIFSIGYVLGYNKGADYVLVLMGR